MAKTHLINGEDLTVEQLSEKHDISISTIHKRIRDNPTKDISDLLYEARGKKTYSINGEHLTVKQLSAKFGITYGALNLRIRRSPKKDISELLYKPKERVLLSDKYPEIAKEWHPTLNGSKKPEDYRNSKEKAWWLCPKTHDYESTIHNRKRGRNCPTCSGQKVSDENRFSIKYPEIAKEWHPTKNGDLKPEDYSYGSGKKAWWLCPEKHDYDARICGRTRGRGCPTCSGKIVSDENRLSIKNPELVKEWHPTKNGDLKPEDYSYGSDRKAWWLCPNGHEYDAVIGNRARLSTGCPRCTNQSSRPEIRILTELKYIFSEVLSRDKSNGAEIDVFIPEFAIGVEYDGSYYHSGSAKNENDKAKNEILEKKGINLVRVREAPLEKLTSSDISVPNKDLDKKALNLIVSEIRARIYPAMKDEITAYIKDTAFNNEELFLTYLSYFPSPFPEHALPSTHHELCKEWHPTKNAPLTPENFSYGSNIKVWWLCPKKHDYDARIANRANGKGCPTCSGRTVSDENRFSIKYPEIAKEWHPIKNGDLKPEDYSYGSHIKVWWLCPKKHDYDATIANRTNGKGCPDPDCMRKKKISDENRLSVRHPEIAKEWHPTKNGDLKPDDYSYASLRKAWWLCPKKHDYHARIGNRTRATRATGCPDCIRENRGKKKEKGLHS